jgi:hypothetical protein
MIMIKYEGQTGTLDRLAKQGPDRKVKDSSKAIIVGHTVVNARESSASVVDVDVRALVENAA